MFCLDVALFAVGCDVLRCSDSMVGLSERSLDEMCVPLVVTSTVRKRSAISGMDFQVTIAGVKRSEDRIRMSLCLCFLDRFPRLSSAAHLHV